MRVIGAVRGLARHLSRLARAGLRGALGLLWLVALAVAAVPALVGISGPRAAIVARAGEFADAERARLAPPLPPAAGVGVGRRTLVWLATPLALPLAVLALDLLAAAVLGIVMPAVWLLDDDGRVTYQWVVVQDLGMAFLAVPCGVLMLLLATRAVPWFEGLEAWRARRLLGPGAVARLEGRVATLTETRSQALDASAVELRRIERDLHDGAQARLVALSLHLGMTEDLFDRDPEAARAMLGEARAGAETAMTELQALVRGIHPPVLADRGLAGALEALALRSPLPVDLDADLGARLPAPLESAVYFSAAELVTNAVRHSGAERIAVTVRASGGRLALTVSDDGRGGADRTRGSGLRGIEQRLAPFDGTLRVTSPPGGPTVATVEL